MVKSCHVKVTLKRFWRTYAEVTHQQHLKVSTQACLLIVTAIPLHEYNFWRLQTCFRVNAVHSPGVIRLVRGVAGSSFEEEGQLPPCVATPCHISTPIVPDLCNARTCNKGGGNTSIIFATTHVGWLQIPKSSDYTERDPIHVAEPKLPDS